LFVKKEWTIFPIFLGIFGNYRVVSKFQNFYAFVLRFLAESLAMFCGP